MKVTKKELTYNFDFENDQEIMEFVEWCIENQNIMHVFRIHCYTKNNNNTGAAEFKDEEGAMAFKLRWL